MQTFLPFENYHASARYLDDKRLGKQRVECVQILNTLFLDNFAGGWRNHPAVRMWRGHECELARYGIAMSDEWTRRDKADSCRLEFERVLSYCEDTGPPEWMGDERVHASHRSNLHRKDPIHYSIFASTGPLPYFWPV
jgi:hypothetical protein